LFFAHLDADHGDDQLRCAVLRLRGVAPHMLWL